MTTVFKRCRCEKKKRRKTDGLQVDKNGREFMLFRIDVYFAEYLLAEEMDEKKTC